MTLMTGFRIVTVAVVFGLVALLLWVGQPANLWWWASALPTGAWVVGPAAVPYLLAAKWSRGWVSIVMFTYFAASSALSGLVYFDAFYRSRSSTAALVLVFIPLYQWCLLAVLLMGCWGVAWLLRRATAGRRPLTGG